MTGFDDAHSQAVTVKLRDQLRQQLGFASATVGGKSYDERVGAGHVGGCKNWGGAFYGIIETG